MNDLKFALRQLRKSPGFTFLAVLTLALGIGMNTAIFSLIQRPFPARPALFQEPQRVVRIYGESKERDLKQMPDPRYRNSGTTETGKPFSRASRRIGATASS